MVENTNNADALLTNGTAFAALIGEVVILPNGRHVSEEVAEDMGWEECDEGALTPACAEAVARRAALLDSSAANRADFDAAEAAKVEAAKQARARRIREEAAWRASPEGKAQAARELAAARAMLRTLNAIFAR